MKKCYLVLEDGHIFEGMRFGAEGDAIGELVFNTGMVGYESVLTDPNNYGQIVLMTFPMIGNYGIIPADLEGKKAFLNGFVAREWCSAPSNFRCEETLDAYLKSQNVVGIYGVDTREITRIIRDKGVMNAKIVDEPGLRPTDGLADYTVSNALQSVCSGQKSVIAAKGEKRFTVAMIDYGSCADFACQLSIRGCDVLVFPYDVTADELLSAHPDGVLLSDGPGNPADNAACIAEIKKLLGVKPIFGIGLGHQMLALASGAKTEKLRYGHRGGNQPAKSSDGRTFISTQNHGYAVLSASLPDGAKQTFENANDHTCEGVDYPSLRSFSVQFPPLACKGPQDTTFLYDAFTALMDSAPQQ